MSEECKHIWNAHRQCQWCHRTRDDIELEQLREERPRLLRALELLREVVQVYDKADVQFPARRLLGIKLSRDWAIRARKALE